MFISTYLICHMLIWTHIYIHTSVPSLTIDQSRSQHIIVYHNRSASIVTDHHQSSSISIDHNLVLHTVRYCKEASNVQQSHQWRICNTIDAPRLIDSKQQQWCCPNFHFDNQHHWCSTSISDAALRRMWNPQSSSSVSINDQKNEHDERSKSSIITIIINITIMIVDIIMTLIFGIIIAMIMIITNILPMIGIIVMIIRQNHEHDRHHHHHHQDYNRDEHHLIVPLSLCLHAALMFSLGVSGHRAGLLDLRDDPIHK